MHILVMCRGVVLRRVESAEVWAFAADWAAGRLREYEGIGAVVSARADDPLPDAQFLMYVDLCRRGLAGEGCRLIRSL